MSLLLFAFSHQMVLNRFIRFLLLYNDTELNKLRTLLILLNCTGALHLTKGQGRVGRGWGGVWRGRIRA